METSDSECFESADEEFYSDEENTNTVISTRNREASVNIAKLSLNDNKQSTGPQSADFLCSEQQFSEETIEKVQLLRPSFSATNKIATLPEESPDNKQHKKQLQEEMKKRTEQLSVRKKDDEKIAILPTAEPKKDEVRHESQQLNHESSTIKKSTTKNEQQENVVCVTTAECMLGDLNIQEMIDIAEKKGNVNRKLETNLSSEKESLQKHVEEKCNSESEELLEVDQTIEINKGMIRVDCLKVAKNFNQPVRAENLWDDDEIDWGKEEQLSTNLHSGDYLSSNDEIRSGQRYQTVDEKKPCASTEKDEDDLWGEDEDWGEAKAQSKSEAPTWGNWGNWGSSILSTATHSVSTLTNQVSQGLTTVLESGMGIPDPEELARRNKEEKERLKQAAAMEEERGIEGGFAFGNWMSGVTKLVETTGSKVITGGLDTLETIGKKTMEVLQEGDPGLKKKRAFLTIDQEKPVLSHILREAKEKAEQENRELEQRHFAKKAKNYETLFDDHQGLVHLEALEMLSKQCDMKLQTLLENSVGGALTEMQETMEQVKELCELPDEDEDDQLIDDIESKLETAVSEMNVPISYSKLITTWEETEKWLNAVKLEFCNEHELHQQAIETLAQLTAIAVEQFHKTGELLLVKDHRSTADEADSLVQLTTILTSLVGIVAAKFSDKLNAKGASSNSREEMNGLITNVFFEAANSSSYIQDAFQLLIPVLQVGAV